MGFIGMHLCKMLKQDGHDVIGLDLKNGYDIIDCSLPERDEVDCVFHLAAQTDARCKDALRDVRDNVVTAVRVMQRYDSKVVFSSSCAVNYPTSPYAISKLACEHYAKIFGCGVVRFCNIYGEGGHGFIDKYSDCEFVNANLPGDQIRTYANVIDACEALLTCRSGELKILAGVDMTVKEIIADQYQGKKVNWLPPNKFDLIEGRQVYGL